MQAHTNTHTHMCAHRISRLLSICLWRIEHESSWHTMKPSTEHKGINRILKVIRSKQTQNLNCIVDDEVYIASEFNGINTLTLEHPIQNNNNNNSKKKRCTHSKQWLNKKNTRKQQEKLLAVRVTSFFLRNVFFAFSFVLFFPSILSQSLFWVHN